MNAAMTRARQFWAARRSAGLDGLIPFGWSGTLLATLGGLLISFLLFGFWWPYWRVADMDFMMVYQAFLLNAGRPQDFFDHPGYLDILLLAGWFKVLHQFGILHVISLADIPAASDLPGFTAAWTGAVRAGRVLSLIIAGVFVVAFAELLRKLIRDWRVAALAAFCLAFSGGLAMQARTMRTELLAAALVIIGLLLLLIAARSPRLVYRPLLVGLAAMLCTLGVVNKVQVVLLASALPLMILFFGCRDPEAGKFWRTPATALPAVAVLAIIAALLAVPAGGLIAFGLSPAAIAAAHLPAPAFGYYGLYQAALAIWVIAAMAAFAGVWRVPVAETAAAMLCVLAGVALGLLSLDLLYNPRDVVAVVNPIEQMLVYATWSNPALGQGGGAASAQFLKLLGAGVLEVLARQTFVLHTSSRPSLVLEWIVIAGAVLAWRRGDRRLFWQLGVLLAAGWAVDIVGTLRGLKSSYYIFTDPLIIIAAGWLLMNLPDLKTYR